MSGEQPENVSEFVEIVYLEGFRKIILANFKRKNSLNIADGQRIPRPSNRDSIWTSHLNFASELRILKNNGFFKHNVWSSILDQNFWYLLASTGSGLRMTCNSSEARDNIVHRYRWRQISSRSARKLPRELDNWISIIEFLILFKISGLSTALMRVFGQKFQI